MCPRKNEEILKLEKTYLTDINSRYELCEHFNSCFFPKCKNSKLPMRMTLRDFCGVLMLRCKIDIMKLLNVNDIKSAMLMIFYPVIWRLLAIKPQEFEWLIQKIKSTSFLS